MAHDFGVIENDRHRIETELRGPVRYDIRAELFLYLKLLGVRAFRLLSRPALFTFRRVNLLLQRNKRNKQNSSFSI